ncbi:hypothetical protein ACHQM5_023189 [Ranunculus cassubicifolius]
MANYLKFGSGREPSTLSRSNNTNNNNGGDNLAETKEDTTTTPIVHHHNETKIDRSLLINLKYLALDSLISEGSTSTVYKGWYKKHPVAVKIMQSDVTSRRNPVSKENFLREVMMLSRVKHENLVKFIGACMEPRMLIVMELMKGGSLKKYLMDMRPCCPDLPTSICFALDIAQVMECLHSNGIIHRDLKPGNLLLTEDRKRIKLVDFGLAREETVNEMMSSEVGTPRWMAPELYSSVTLLHGEKKHYDHKVDIYSFSIVLWELLTNSTPFKGMSSVQAAYAIIKKERPSLDNVPSELVPLLESCWAEDPAGRPEFSDIIVTLSKFYESLQITHDLPPALKHMDEQQNFGLVMDSPGTRHLMERSEEVVERKSRSSSPKFLRCFDKCFAK